MTSQYNILQLCNIFFFYIFCYCSLIDHKLTIDRHSSKRLICNCLRKLFQLQYFMFPYVQCICVHVYL